MRNENPMIPESDSPRNWTEDYPHENGNYICFCKTCNNTFIGHKRRILCKECDEKAIHINFTNRTYTIEEIEKAIEELPFSQVLRNTIKVDVINNLKK